MSSLVLSGLKYDPAQVRGLRGVFVRMLVRVLRRLLRRELPIVDVHEPPPVKALMSEMLTYGEAPPPSGEAPPIFPPGPVDRYQQPVVPQPIPINAFADERAVRYAYRSRRRFAAPEGDDFEHVPKGAEAKPTMTKSRR